MSEIQRIYIIGESTAERRRRETRWFGKPLPEPKKRRRPAMTAQERAAAEKHAAYRRMQAALENRPEPTAEPPETFKEEPPTKPSRGQPLLFDNS